MRRFVIAGLIIISPIAAQAQDEDAKQLAQKILDKGSVLFATKDAAAMARTYTEAARVEMVSKDKDSQEYKFDVREGRPAIEQMYADMYKNTNEAITSRNAVEFARRVGPDLLVIYGTFEPTVGKGDAFPFVQVRKHEGDKWLILSLQLFVVSKE